jgi:hypothetical protein
MNPEIPSQPAMRPADILLYLIGNRGAIERIAATRHAWLVGAILVLSAGIARNYDHLHLLREPEWFIGPFAASLVSVGLIFVWISAPLRLAKAGDYGRQFGTFLVLAWMTAPCAWLYGIPVEAMTDIVTATKWNIAFLAIVAFWRVAIIVRAVSVLTEVSWTRVLPLVLAPAALEAMVGSFFQGLSLIGIMGGVRLSPDTKLLVQAANFTTVASFGCVIVFFIASFFLRGVAEKPLFRPAAEGSRALFAMAALMLLAWALASIPLQPQIANSHALREFIRNRDFDGAIAFASGRTRQDFPRHRYLPPEPTGYFNFKLIDHLPADAPLWLREEWIHNATESLKLRLPYDAEEWQSIGKNHPEIRESIDRHAKELRGRLESLDREDENWLQDYDRLASKSASASGDPPPPH